jgi:hypothetical protein
MTSRPRVQAYLSHDLRKRLRAYCAARGVAESAVVAAALHDYFEADAKDNALIMRRLDRLSRAMGRVQRGSDVHSEAFASFVQMWFAYTPELEESAKDSATRSALGRYRRFIDHVAGKVADGARLVSDVAGTEPEPPSDDVDRTDGE